MERQPRSNWTHWLPAVVGPLAILVVAAVAAPAGAGGLDVSVGKTRIIMRGVHCPVLLKLADGSIIVDAASRKGTRSDGRVRKAVISTDGGQMWKDSPNTVLVSHDGSLCVLPDGTVLAFGYHTRPVEGRPDVYTTNRWVSTDNWKTIQDPDPLYVEMPDIIRALDDGGKGYYGPLFHGRSVALADGTILTTMYGKFGADKKFGGDRKRRSVLVKSTDRGKNWKYISTIASLHGITDSQLLKGWQDGFGEPTLAVLPDGKMICAMRTGTYVGQKTVPTYHDLSKTIVRGGKYIVSNGKPCRPIYQATSTDGGKTWSKPRPVPGAVGACPRLLVLDNGVLALSFGRFRRPTQGVGIMFSTDGGETWSKRTELFGGLSSGYTDMVALGPGKLLYVHDSVTAWAPTFTPDWIGAVDIEVTIK